MRPGPGRTSGTLAARALTRVCGPPPWQPGLEPHAASSGGYGRASNGRSIGILGPFPPERSAPGAGDVPTADPGPAHSPEGAADADASAARAMGSRTRR